MLQFGPRNFLDDKKYWDKKEASFHIFPNLYMIVFFNYELKAQERLWGPRSSALKQINLHNTY